MAFKLKNPLKTPLKQNHPQEQFGPQLPDNIDPRDLLAPPAPQYSTRFPKIDDPGYSKGNVDGKRIIRFNRSSTTNQPRESRYEPREFSGFPDVRKPIDVANLNEAQRMFYERYTNPEVRKKLKKQGIFGTGEAVTDEDIDNMLSATLNVPMIETEDVGRPDADATYTNYDNPTIIGGGKIRYRPKVDVYDQYEELAHVALAHLQEPALREILGSPVDAGQNNPYAQSQRWLPYLNTPSELAANFYELRERINLKPNEQIESVEAVTDEDIDNMLSATLNVPMIETEDVGRPDADATYTNYDNPTIIGGGKIRYRPKVDVYDQYEELAHVALAHLQEPALREILGSPVDAGQNNPYAQSQRWLPYLNTPSELAANFYELRERINLKPNEQIESVEALEERLKQAKGVNWSDRGFQRGEDEILSIYDTPEEREKLLEALNTIASNEQKSPGITKWNQLSAKEMLTDIEENKQMYS